MSELVTSAHSVKLAIAEGRAKAAYLRGDHYGPGYPEQYKVLRVPADTVAAAAVLEDLADHLERLMLEATDG